MLKVNNKKTIRLLSKSTFNGNKLRNIFAVIAIVLTTVLFTGLFTISSSLLSSMEESTMRQVGGSFHGGFKYLTMEEYDQLKTHKSIKEISYSEVLGIAENKELEKRPTEIRYTNDKINAQGMFSMPTTGRLPQYNDEIATDSLVLERLNIPAKLGQKVKIEYSVNEEKRSDTFTLVGFWQGDKLMQASQVWLNRSYVEKSLEGYIPEQENDTIGTINANVNFSNTFDIEGKLRNIILDSGYAIDDIDYGVNWAYTGNNESFDLGTIVGAGAGLLTIVFCGYLIISNIFYISITKDVRYYGLLKTIGTTSKQIRAIIRKQALFLCLIGVPLGLISGYFVGAILTPMVLSTMSTDVIKVDLNPIFFILSVLFSMATVFISLSKASKLAAKISPIESLRRVDSYQVMKKKAKKSHQVNLFEMAYYNILRNKRKAVLVTLSLSLSLIILNGAYSLANSFDMDKYVADMIGSDFVVGDLSNFNVNIYYSNQDTLSPDFLKDLGSQKGIERINNIYFKGYLAPTDPQLFGVPKQIEEKLEITGKTLERINDQLEDTKQWIHVYGLDDDAFKRLNVLEGSIALDKLKTGNYVVANAFDENGEVRYYHIGDMVNLPKDNGETKEYEVIAIATIPHNMSIKHTHPLTPSFYLPSDVFLSQITQKTPMLTTFDVADSFEKEMASYLKTYCQEVDSNMEYQSKATVVAEYENTQRTYKTVGVTLSILLAIIGIMNFMNTIITSIIARKREFAMLQSIGMTNSQVKKMLIFEGIMYTGLTLIVTLTLGSILCYLGLSAFVSGASYMSMHFTIVPSLICFPILLMITVMVPLLSQKAVNKTSIVERLREVE
jgi:putative ABC transport system permease protein